MKFSVIIPTYNDWNRLGKCLAALDNQTIGKDRYEVIVVINDKSGTVTSDLNFPAGVQLIHEPRPGSYMARNKGAEIAKGQILAFTDSDCIPDKNWLVNAEKKFNESNCDLIGGRVDIFKGENSDKYGYLYERFTAFHQQKNVPLGKSVTANLFIKKTVFEEVSGFDSNIKSGGDWELTQRCTEMGYNMVYGNDVLVLHPARNLKTILKKQYRLTCGGALNVKKKYGHSHLRILGSHLLHGLFKNRDYTTEPNRKERAIIFSIDLMKYIYRTMIYGGLLFRFIDPDKVRE